MGPGGGGHGCCARGAFATATETETATATATAIWIAIETEAETETVTENASVSATLIDGGDGGGGGGGVAARDGGRESRDLRNWRWHPHPPPDHACRHHCVPWCRRGWCGRSNNASVKECWCARGRCERGATRITPRPPTTRPKHTRTLQNATPGGGCLGLVHTLPTTPGNQRVQLRRWVCGRALAGCGRCFAPTKVRDSSDFCELSGGKRVLAGVVQNVIFIPTNDWSRP